MTDTRSQAPIYTVPEDELVFRFVRSPGPGGQNVNKVATAVELRFVVADSAVLPDAVKERFIKRYANRINKDGVLVIAAHRFRSQERNRDDAVARLHEMIASVALPPTPRRATKPTTASRRRRLESKSHRGRVKQSRRKPGSDD